MIAIDRDSHVSAYVQVYEALKQDIERGAYSVDDKLPSVRYLAHELSVSRNTIGKAYEQLYAEGYVVSKDRSGFHVDPAIFDVVGVPRERAACEVDPAAPAESGKGARLPYDFFYGGLPDELLPIDALRRAAVAALSSQIEGANAYSDAFGLTGFREQVARYLERTRGVRCSAGQIAVQSGTRDGLERLVKLFDPSRDVMAVEQPGYLGDMQVFANNRFPLAPLNVWPSSLFFDDLEKSGAKLVYVTPSHQFPTGRIMPYSDRVKLIEWADANDAFIVEDDYDSEYRYGQMPIPSLQSLDWCGRVIYSGTFSKAFSPGLRVSYLVLPPLLLEQYRERLQSYWCPVPWFVQKTLAILLEEGGYERHVRRQVKHFRASQALLVGALHSVFAEKVRIHGEGAGLHLWLEVDDPRSSGELVELARREGVGVYSPERYWVEREKADRSTVLMGYSAIPHDKITKGVELLGKAWKMA